MQILEEQKLEEYVASKTGRFHSVTSASYLNYLGTSTLAAMQKFTFLHFTKEVQLEFSVNMHTLTTVPSFTVSLNVSFPNFWLYFFQKKKEQQHQKSAPKSFTNISAGEYCRIDKDQLSFKLLFV